LLRTVLLSRDVAQRLAVVLAAVVITAAPAAAQSSSFDYGGYRPHYQGYGVDTRAGRGGAIYKVTHLMDTLDPSSPYWNGSFRKAVQAPGPRFVIFEVSGNINLVTAILVMNPFLTIAGQTAPSPGITIRNHPIYLDTHDVVIQHIRLRKGDTYYTGTNRASTLYVRNNAYNIVLDHNSISWGTTTTIGVNAWSGPQVQDIAVLDCIISEGLAKPYNPYGIGSLFLDSRYGTATVARNLWAHNGNRNPWFGPGWRFSGYNNVIYNAAGVAGDQGTLGFLQLMNGYPTTSPSQQAWIFEGAWVGNVALSGPNTHPDTKPIKVSLDALQAVAGYQLYLADNTGPYMTLANQWSGVTYQQAATERSVRVNTAPAWHVAFNYWIMGNSQVLPHVLSNVGARPLDRDSVDIRVVNDARYRTGRIITTQGEVGGFPVLAQNRRPLTVPADPHVVVDAHGRTRVEAWLEGFARALEPWAAGRMTLSAPTGLHLTE
jgi:hypothetical protein